MDDWALIREYVDKGSQAAFTMLVERHVNLVYSVCLRELGDTALAEDVTQVVFLILARKAATLREGTVVAGWLFNTARYASRDARKQEGRRQRREQKAVADMIGESRTQDASWADLEPLLHDGLARLGGAERDALILRFFEGKSVKEIGALLGVSTDAAQKRITRALDKLRRFFARHGYSVAAGVLVALLTEHAVQAAPVGCVVAAAKLGTSIGGTGAASNIASTKVLSLSQGVFKSMLVGQVKAVTVACVGLTLTGAGVGHLARLAARPARVRPVVMFRAPVRPHPAQSTPSPTLPLNGKGKGAQTVMLTTHSHVVDTVRASAPFPLPLRGRAGDGVGLPHPARVSPPVHHDVTPTSAPRLAASVKELPAPRATDPVAPAPKPLVVTPPAPTTAVATTRAIAPTNVFPYGDFEKLDDRGQALHWQYDEPAQSTIVAENGNHFLRLTNTTANVPLAARSVLQADPAWKTIMVLVRMRLAATSDKSLARLAYLFIDAQGQATPVPHIEQLPAVGSTRGWVSIAALAVVPPGTVQIQIVPQAVGVGVADFDDIQVLPNPPLPQAPTIHDGALNESFEKPSPAGAPSEWTMGDARRARIVEEEGNHFLRLSNDQAKNFLHAVIRVRLDPAWKRLRLSARMRATNLQVGTQGYQNARISTTFLDRVYNRVGSWPPGLELVRDNDWIEMVTELTVPPGALILELSPQMIGSIGEVDFDDIKLGPAKPLDPLPVRPGMPEGGFEQADADGSPTGWSLIDPRYLSIVEENGNHFLRFSNPDQPVLRANGIFQIDPAWRKLKLNVRMRSSRLESAHMGWEAAELAFDFINAAGETFGPMQTMPSLKAATGWTTQEVELTVPVGAVAIMLKPELIHKFGTVDFDDIRLVGEPATTGQ